MQTSVTLSDVSALIEGRHENPFQILGPHEVVHAGRRALAVRAYFPSSKQVWVIDETHQVTRPMRRIHPAGLYEAICPLSDEPTDRRYQLRVNYERGEPMTIHDPYRFDPLLSDYDLYLLGEGTHSEIYNKLGAQIRTVDGVRGVNFAVWAPNAESVQIVGNFNFWDGRQHAARKLIPAGVWELFIPDLEPGETYKYCIKMAGGATIHKADPFGFAAELPPKTASVVADLDRFQWNDDDWLAQRAVSDLLKKPVSIYEVHLGSWKRGEGRQHGWLSYRDLAHQLVDYCLEMGYTHLELLPINEHPFSGSWGYQTVGYYAPTSRFGPPEDFMYFVDYCHSKGIGVMIDWVPAHFPKDDHGLRLFDGTALYEHADPQQGEHPDWGTMIFNYDRNEVCTFLLANAMFWLDKYHIDGLRVDAVASMLYLDYSREEGQWIPNEYGGREKIGAISLLRQFNEMTHGKYPGILTVAEESTDWGGVSRPTDSGGLGFSLKWNMGWMNDSLRYFRQEPIHRKYHHDELTFSMIYAFSENFALPLSHDEVVHGKGSLLDQMPGDLWQKFANLRLLYSYMWTHPGKKLLFMGNDFGQWHEWNHDTSLQWDLLQWDTHQGLKRMVADLNALYRREPALYEVDFEDRGFEWIDCLSREDSVLAYLRKAENADDYLLVCCNFTPVIRQKRRVGVPHGGWFQEIFNSDSKHYGGSNLGNFAGANAERRPAQGRSWSIEITLPPLGVLVLKPQK